MGWKQIYDRNVTAGFLFWKRFFALEILFALSFDQDDLILIFHI